MADKENIASVHGGATTVAICYPVNVSVLTRFQVSRGSFGSREPKAREPASDELARDAHE